MGMAPCLKRGGIEVAVTVRVCRTGSTEIRPALGGHPAMAAGGRAVGADGGVAVDPGPPRDVGCDRDAHPWRIVRVLDDVVEIGAEPELEIESIIDAPAILREHRKLGPVHFRMRQRRRIRDSLGQGPIEANGIDLVTEVVAIEARVLEIHPDLEDVLAVPVLRDAEGFDKLYAADVIFGVTTETCDAEGRFFTTHPTEAGDPRMLGLGEITAALGQLLGTIDQVPPSYSALKIAGEAAARPVTWGELFATLYHNLGIDSHRATLPDLTGRPQYLVEDGANPLPELV